MTKFHYTKLNQPSLSAGAKDLKNFIVVNGELYHQGNVGVLARTLFSAKPKKNLTNDLSCGKNDISLYSTCRDKGFIGLARDGAEMQMACMLCQEPLDVEEYLFIEEAA